MNIGRDDVFNAEEREYFNSLRGGFNVFKEDKSHLSLSANRVEIARPWAGMMLNVIIGLNIISLGCFAASVVVLNIKPQPDFYATAGSGKVYGPLKKLR